MRKFAFDKADIEEREEAAIEAAKRAAVELVDEITDENVIVRDLMPELDLDSGTDNSWTNNERWEQTGLSDGSNRVYKIDPSSRAENKAIAIYGITSNKSTPLTTRIKFMKGAEGSGMGVKDYVDIEPAYNKDEILLLLKDVVLYKPGEEGHILQIIDGSGDENIVLLGVVAEKAGETISAPE